MDEQPSRPVRMVRMEVVDIPNLVKEPAQRGKSRKKFGSKYEFIIKRADENLGKALLWRTSSRKVAARFQSGIMMLLLLRGLHGLYEVRTKNNLLYVWRKDI